MEDVRPLAAITTRHSGSYVVLEDPDTVVELWDASATAGTVIALTTVTGTFPSETLWIRGDEIASVREMSEATWEWSCQATMTAYASQSHPAHERMVELQERAVAAVERVAGDGNDDDD